MIYVFINKYWLVVYVCFISYVGERCEYVYCDISFGNIFWWVRIGASFDRDVVVFSVGLLAIYCVICNMQQLISGCQGGIYMSYQSITLESSITLQLA